jgi:hypothetical protein
MECDTYGLYVAGVPDGINDLMIIIAKDGASVNVSADGTLFGFDNTTSINWSIPQDGSPIFDGNGITLNNILYYTPTIQGSADTVMVNNGSGVLTWSTISSLGYLKNNLGIAGGTTLIGGTGANESLNIFPTSNFGFSLGFSVF